MSKKKKCTPNVIKTTILTFQVWLWRAKFNLDCNVVDAWNLSPILTELKIKGFKINIPEPNSELLTFTWLAQLSSSCRKCSLHYWVCTQNPMSGIMWFSERRENTNNLRGVKATAKGQFKLLFYFRPKG